MTTSAGRTERFASHPTKTAETVREGSRFLKDTIVAPRALALAQRFPGNVRQDLLQVPAGGPLDKPAGPSRPSCPYHGDRSPADGDLHGPARFSIDTNSGRVTVSQLAEKDGKVRFIRDEKATVINLPARINGFWLDPFLLPWRQQIADYLIDHHATGSEMDWYLCW